MGSKCRFQVSVAYAARLCEVSNTVFRIMAARRGILRQTRRGEIFVWLSDAEDLKKLMAKEQQERAVKLGARNG